MGRLSGILFIALGAGVGSFFARHPSPLLRTAAIVAGTLVVVWGGWLFVRAQPRTGDENA